MLHITKFYRKDCLPCGMLDNELEILQLDDTFTVPFVLHAIDIDEVPEFKTQYDIKNVPLLIFEDIPEYVHGPGKEKIPAKEYEPSPSNTYRTIIGALEGFHRYGVIKSYIDEYNVKKALSGSCVKIEIKKDSSKGYTKSPASKRPKGSDYKVKNYPV